MSDTGLNTTGRKNGMVETFARTKRRFCGCALAVFVFSHPWIYRFAGQSGHRWFRAWAADDPKAVGDFIYVMMGASRDAFLMKHLMLELLGLPIEVIESPLFREYFDVTGVPGKTVGDKVSVCMWSLMACTNQTV